MLRHCFVGVVLVALCGETCAQGITIDTVTPDKDTIKVEGKFSLNGKAYLGGLLQLKISGTWKDYGSIKKYTSQMGGAYYTYEAKTDLSVAKGTYEVRMELNAGGTKYHSTVKSVMVDGP